MGEKGDEWARDEPEVAAVLTAWEDTRGPQSRRSGGGWGTLGKEGDTACPAAWLILMRKKQVVDGGGRDEFHPILGMEKSCRGLRKEDSSFRVATAFNLLWPGAIPGKLEW